MSALTAKMANNASHPKSSSAELERLAEDQATAITELEIKQSKLEEEKQNQENKATEIAMELLKKEEELIQRYMHLDFKLAQSETFIPYKRARSNMTVHVPRIHSLQQQELEQSHQCGLLDPAINIVYKQLYENAKSAQTRLKQSYDDFIAWKFSPDSASGKRLMSRLRQLLASNAELGRINQTDLLRRLESEVGTQTTCIKEFVKSNHEMEGVLDEASLDLEGLQSSLLIVKQQIAHAENVARELKIEYDARRPGEADTVIAAATFSLGGTSEATEDHATTSVNELEKLSEDHEEEIKPNTRCHSEPASETEAFASKVVDYKEELDK